MKKIKIGVIGLGYVGLPLAFELSKKYYTVGFDLKKERIDQLKKRIDINNEINLKKTKCFFTHKKELLKNCNIFIITVPTPVNSQNKPDLKLIKNATKLVAKYLKKKSIVIFESTVFPGTTLNICKPLLEKVSNLKFNTDFFCGYSPERINPGDRKNQLTNIKKIVAGSNKFSLNVIDKIYKSIIKAGTFRCKTIEVAESAKIIENIQRDVNVALMNELQIVFDKLNIDFEKILQAARTKWNFLNFYPGLVGGHCIGVDPYYLSYLANKNKLKTKIINLSRKINNSMSEYHANIISSKLKKQRMKKILILGFAFKENCSDFRNTGVFGLYSSLRSKSFKTDVYDPLVNAVSVKKYYQVSIIKKITKKYDCIIIAVKHNLFKKIKIRKHLKEKSNFIYDIKKNLVY